ncbi:MAG: hypothetical protein ABGX04_18650 [Myxococcales bacterium]
MSESVESEQASEADHPRRIGRLDFWHVLAVLIFTSIGLITFRDVLRAGPMSSAMVSSPEHLLGISEGDVTFEAWLTARNARTIATAPHQLFDTPHCAPADKTLTLGVPMVTMGLLAVPVAFFTENPALAYNFSTFLLLTLSALAMYLLVRDWTGVAAAGVIAGLLYAFNPIRLGIYITHPSVWDSGWLVFGIFFSRRLFAYGRWRDAIGLALVCSLQVGASFYPLLAATLMSPAFVIWLVYRYGFRKVRWIQLAFVAAIIGGVAVLLLGPYLDTREAGEIGGRTEFFFVRWSDFLPGRHLFLGWAAMIFGLIGILAPRKQVFQRLGGDPRWALLAGALVTIAVAAGPFNNQLLGLVWPSAPFQIPDLYEMLAALVPGLDSIRVVFRLSVAMLISVCVFAGIGAAWLIVRFGKYAAHAGAVMVVLAMLSVVPEPSPRGTVLVRADPQEVQFFQQLEAMGNRGPILEVPLMTGIARSLMAPSRILLTAYHHRRISTCFGSFRAPARKVLGELVEALPEPSAVDGLRDLGFTTLLINKKAVLFAYQLGRSINARAAGQLPLLLEGENFVAYDLVR